MIGKQTQVIIFASLALALYGYDQGMMSLVNTNADYLHTMGIDEESSWVGVIVAVYYAGTAVGSVIASKINDRFGRKPCIYVSLIVTILGNLVMFFAGFNNAPNAFAQMLAGRIVLGLGVGAIDMVIPVFSAELSHDSGRGRALAQEFQYNIAGLLLAYSINLVCTHQLGGSSHLAWRLPIVIMNIFPILLLSFLFTLPETPRYLLSKEKDKHAKRSLEIVLGKKEAATSFEELVEARDDEKGHPVHYSDMLLPGGKQFHPTVVVILGQVNQALTGYGSVSVFGPQIFQLLGYTKTKAQYITLGNYISYFLFMTLGWLLIDRLGRRPLMLIGSIVLTSCFALLTLFGGLSVHAADLGISTNSVAIPGSVLLYIATIAFGVCWLTTPWLIPTEVYNNSARSQGSAVSVVIWGICNALVTLGTPPGFNSLRYWLFLVFAGTNTFALVSTWLYIPETGSRSFEENQEYFEKAQELGSWRVSKVAKGAYRRLPGSNDGERQALLS